MKNESHSEFKNASDEAVFYLYKTVYGPLGYTDDQIRAQIIEKRAARTGKPTESVITAIRKKEKEREKLMAYCNGDSALIDATYSNFTAEQISAFIEDFL